MKEAVEITPSVNYVAIISVWHGKSNRSESAWSGEICTGYGVRDAATNTNTGSVTQGRAYCKHFPDTLNICRSSHLSFAHTAKHKKSATKTILL